MCALVSEEGYRIDGRRPKELRRIQCALGVFRHADGSAYYEQGSTKVLATVYGPYEGRLSAKTTSDRVSINCQFSMTTFSTNDRRQKPRGDRKATEISIQMSECFQSIIVQQFNSRCQIDIFFEVLQADGSVFAASFNAAILALVDSGIPIKDFAVACTASTFENQGLIDLSNSEESAANPEVTIVVLPRSNQIVYMQLESKIHEQQLDSLINTALKGCAEIFSILDAFVKTDLSRLPSSELTDTS